MTDTKRQKIKDLFRSSRSYSLGTLPGDNQILLYKKIFFKLPNIEKKHLDCDPFHHTLASYYLLPSQCLVGTGAAAGSSSNCKGSRQKIVWENSSLGSQRAGGNTWSTNTDICEYLKKINPI